MEYSFAAHTCLMSRFTRYVNNPYFYLNNNRMSSMLSEGPLRLLLIFSEKANVHRWCLHAYQQDMSWATALRFIMILDLSTTGEYVVLNVDNPINFTLHDNLNKWCNRTWNTIFGFYCEKTFQLKRCHCLIYLLLKGYHSTLVISDSIILFKCPSLECIEATSNCVRLQCKLFVYARIRKII